MPNGNNVCAHWIWSGEDENVFSTDGLFNKISVQSSLFLQNCLFMHGKNICKDNNSSYNGIVQPPVDCKHSLLFHR